MVISAVLPPSTAWGFEFTPTTTGKEQSPNNTQTFNPFTSFTSNSSNAFNNRQSMKRKASFPDRNHMDEDEEDDLNHNYNTTNNNQPQQHQQPPQHRPIKARAHATPRGGISKRPRVQHFAGRKLPILRVVESLDRKALQNMIENICQANPEIAEHVTNIAPRVTIASAIDILKKHMESIYQNLPYGKDEQRGDYAYLRVRPAIEEFFSALVDYTSHFLPPNEQQPSNTLAFLDDATNLLHKLPVWSNPLHNHQKNVAYDEISNAWCLAIKEASKRVGVLGLAHGGWENVIQQHNQASGNRLSEAVECINQELSWLGAQDQGNNSMPTFLNHPRPISAVNGWN